MNPTLNANDFFAKLSGNIDRILADKAAGKKSKRLKPDKDVVAKIRAEAAALHAAETLIDPYAGWKQKSKVLWVSRQVCQHCEVETNYIGGVFVEVENPRMHARAYIRRAVIDPLPTRIEVDPKVEIVPFCVICFDALTQPFEPDVIDQLIATFNNQLSLF